MILDLSSFENAIKALAKALNEYENNPNEFVRDSIIQRFEFTYEQCHKYIKRFLELTEASPSKVDEMSFAQLIRTASEKSLLKGEWSDWKFYRKCRGRTSHTYDEAIALSVLGEIPEFLLEAQYLLEKLKERNEE